MENTGKTLYSLFYLFEGATHDRSSFIFSRTSFLWIRFSGSI